MSEGEQSRGDCSLGKGVVGSSLTHSSCRISVIGRMTRDADLENYRKGMSPIKTSVGRSF